MSFTFRLFLFFALTLWGKPLLPEVPKQDENQPIVCYVVFGLPGSGKGTLAQYLQQHSDVIQYLAMFFLEISGTLLGISESISRVPTGEFSSLGSAR